MGKPVCAVSGWNVCLEIHPPGSEQVTCTDTPTFLELAFNQTILGLWGPRVKKNFFYNWFNISILRSSCTNADYHGSETVLFSLLWKAEGSDMKSCCGEKDGWLTARCTKYKHEQKPVTWHSVPLTFINFYIASGELL